MSSPVADTGPEAFQPLYRGVDFLCQPALVFGLCMAAFAIALRFRRKLVNPAVAGGLFALMAGLFAIGLLHPTFSALALRADNIAIWLLFGSTFFFLWVAFYQAEGNDRRMEAGLPTSEAEAAKEKVLVWPYLLYAEAIVAVFCLVLLFAWSMALDAPLESFADPSTTPNPSKAPWYFLGLQEMLVYFDPWIAGVMLPGLIIGGLMAIPYCDPNPEGVGFFTFQKRKFAISIFLFGFLVLWLLLIFIGTFLRGPNWCAFGLFQTWDINQAAPQENVNLSEYFYRDLLGRELPEVWWVREALGLLLVAGYFLGLPAWGARVFRKPYRRLGFIRYAILALLGLAMLGLPIKMLLRWTLDLKYLVSMPEFMFNI